MRWRPAAVTIFVGLRPHARPAVLCPAWYLVLGLRPHARPATSCSACGLRR